MMNELMMTVFVACANTTVPNIHTVRNLPLEQQQVLSAYVTHKCSIEAKKAQASATQMQPQLKQGVLNGGRYDKGLKTPKKGDL